MIHQNTPCLCGSGKSYAVCCELLHKGAANGDALSLMRSRYTAYALNIPSYIIQTTHPDNPQYNCDEILWAEQISDFSLHTEFKQLEIIDFVQQGDLATVTFEAHLSQKGQDASFREKSDFERVNDRWLYRKGQLY